jgi:hypothetical protein
MALTTITAATGVRDSTKSVVAEALTNADTEIMFQCPKAGKFLIYLDNASAADPVKIIALAGTGNHAGMGNKTFTIAKSTGNYLIGPLSTSRFKSASGTTNWINLSMGAVTTGTMCVIAVP